MLPTLLQKLFPSSPTPTTTTTHPHPHPPLTRATLEHLAWQEDRLSKANAHLTREVEALRRERDMAFQMRDRFFVMGMWFAQKLGLSVGVLSREGYLNSKVAVIEAPSGQVVVAFPNEEASWFHRFPHLPDDYQLTHVLDHDAYFDTIINPLKGQDTVPLPILEDRKQATLPTQVIPSIHPPLKRTTRQRKKKVGGEGHEGGQVGSV